MGVHHRQHRLEEYRNRHFVGHNIIHGKCPIPSQRFSLEEGLVLVHSVLNGDNQKYGVVTSNIYVYSDYLFPQTTGEETGRPV